jgi:hypothetical protein
MGTAAAQEYGLGPLRVRKVAPAPGNDEKRLLGLS